jgi:pimeloyl-ACP methyl ester carboxylesterase
MLIVAALAALQIQLSPCKLDGVPAPAKCGELSVLENRVAGRGRSIRLHVAVIPAAESPRAPDAITYFGGGPGEAAVSSAAYVFGQVGPLHRTHDIMLVDQRGTGGSTPLTCHAFGEADSLQRWLGSFLPLDAIARCRDDLQRRADLTVYTTENLVDDVDDVRAALGYEMLDVTGGSYGSRASLTYVRRHGAHVRSLVISGIAPRSEPVPEKFARDAQVALDGVFAECAQEAACHAAFPDLPGDMRSILARLDREPVHVNVIHPGTGAIVPVTLNRDMFGEGIRYLLYSSGTASWVPAIVHAAADGNYLPIAERALLFRFNLLGTGDTGLYLSVTCDEDLPFVDSARSAALGRDTFLGNYRLNEQLAACHVWPHHAVAASFREPTVSAVPALVFSGERDPVTPASQGTLAVRTLSHAHHFVVKSGGHGYDGLVGVECVDKIIVRFIEQPTAAPDSVCLAASHRAPFPTSLPWARVIVADTSTLRGYVGKYAGGATRLDHGHLLLRLDDQGDMTLAPVAPGQFYVVGSMNTVVRVSHDSLVVEQDGKRVKSLRATAS